MIGQPIQLQNYQTVVTKLNTIRDKTAVQEAASGVFSKIGKAFENVSTKFGVNKFVILQSDTGNESIQVTVNEMAQLLGKKPGTITTQLKTPEGRLNLSHTLDHIPNIAPPPWGEIRQRLNGAHPDTFKTFTKEQMLETLNTLEAHWDEVGKYGQWDEQRQVLHLRRSPEKNSDRTWSLPRSVEIHNTNEGVQIYVLHKGKMPDPADKNKLVRTKKLGEGAYKEVARSVNLNTLKNYVHATIDIQKKALETQDTEKHVRKAVDTEIQLQQQFKNDEEFVQITGWNEYTDKDGSNKIALTLEQCNGGELFDAASNRTEKTGKILNENIDELMQVITDMIQMLVKLEQKEIINRDIKCENIFLNVDANGHVRAKMSDFGIASTHEDAVKHLRKHPNGLGGSPDYVPPEARLPLSPEERSTYATHTWEMGITLHALFTGAFPEYGKAHGIDLSPINTPHLLNQTTIIKNMEDLTLNPQINSNVLRSLTDNPKHFHFLKGMVENMVQIDPKNRPSATELARVLEDFKRAV